MVSIGATASSSSFDPAAHLHKQGWKGKGTALKQGHATRPLAVVQKRTLAGIGKDRDEAVPFWDQIFASTAASIFTPTPSGSSSPVPQYAAHTSTRSWVTASYSPSGSSTPPIKPKTGGGGPSTQARVGKEMARKGLYSRFLRGKTIVIEPEPEEEKVPTPEPIQPVASTSTSPAPAPTMEAEIKETKEERRARRAAKAQRRAEKEARKAAATTATSADALEEPIPAASPADKKERKKDKRKRKDEESQTPATPQEEVPLASADGSRKKSRKKRRYSDNAIGGGTATRASLEPSTTPAGLPISDTVITADTAVQAEAAADRKAEKKWKKEERRRVREGA